LVANITKYDKVVSFVNMEQAWAGNSSRGVIILSLGGRIPEQAPYSANKTLSYTGRFVAKELLVKRLLKRWDDVPVPVSLRVPHLFTTLTGAMTDLLRNCAASALI